MNFWLCRSNFFKYLEDYISYEIKDLEDIITEDTIKDSIKDTENNQQILDLEEDIKR